MLFLHLRHDCTLGQVRSCRRISTALHSTSQDLVSLAISLHAMADAFSLRACGLGQTLLAANRHMSCFLSIHNTERRGAGGLDALRIQAVRPACLQPNYSRTSAHESREVV